MGAAYPYDRDVWILDESQSFQQDNQQGNGSCRFNTAGNAGSWTGLVGGGPILKGDRNGSTGASTVMVSGADCTLQLSLACIY